MGFGAEKGGHSWWNRPSVNTESPLGFGLPVDPCVHIVSTEYSVCVFVNVEHSIACLFCEWVVKEGSELAVLSLLVFGEYKNLGGVKESIG